MFTVQNKPAAVAPKETITHHFWLLELGRRNVDGHQSGAENVVKTETQQTFVNDCSVITLGIYPLEARVYCSQ